MPTCSDCAHDNPPAARFCAHCGAKLARQCPKCAAPVNADQHFCGECGTALIDSQPTPPRGAEQTLSPANYTPPHLARRILDNRQALRGERKQVTVLFCDVVESTALAMRLGAEGMHALLSEFFSLALAEVHRFEGTVNQFLGDGFMAIFGAPLAYEDHAARAGLAAIAIRDAIARARQDVAGPGWEQVHVRLGLNSGQVVVGTIGDDLRMDYTAAGDTTHVAARLQNAAEPGQILCSQATVDAAHGALEATQLAPISLKGVPVPVTPLELLAAHEHTARAAQVRADFVGRETELAELLAIAARAMSGRGGAIEIEGEPGAGKSRLMLEFSARAPGGGKPIFGQCITYGNQRPTVPIIDLVRDLLNREDGSLDTLATAQHDYLRALTGEPAALDRLKTMDPATLRSRTQQALAQWLHARGPTVLIVEDLHWADPSSLDYLRALAGQLAETSTLLVVTFRPGSEPPWPPALRLARLHLSPLSQAACQLLLTQLGTSLTTAQQAEVLARAEGNPFFLEELVRASLIGESLPGDVFDVLGARIDRLTPIDKRQLRMAATIGREFSLDLVEEVAEHATARPRMEAPLSLGFLEPLGTRRYRFVHALTQEVAYQSMLSDERKALHTTLAARLAAKALNAEHDCEDIARHHLAGQTPAAALPYLESATAKAIRNHTLEAAHAFITEAVKLFDAEAMTPAWLTRCVVYLLQAFPVFHFLHKHREYEALLKRYAPDVEALGAPALLGPFLGQLGHRASIAGRFAEAEALLERGLALCDEANDPVHAAHASSMLGWVNANGGRCARSEEYGKRALRYLEHAPIPLFLMSANVGLILSAIFRGHWANAINYAQRARDIGIESHDDGIAAFGGAFLAWVLYDKGDYEEAMEVGERAAAIAPTDYFKGWAVTFWAASAIKLGRGAEWLTILDQAVNYSEQAGHCMGYSVVALVRGEALVELGKFSQAQADMDGLRRLALTIPYPFVSAGALQVQAECAHHLGNANRARALFEASAQEFAAIDAGHRVAQCRARLSRLGV